MILETLHAAPSTFMVSMIQHITICMRKLSEKPIQKSAVNLLQAQRYLTDKAVHGFLFQLPKLGIFKNGITGFWKSAPVLYQPLQAVLVK